MATKQHLRHSLLLEHTLPGPEQLAWLRDAFQACPAVFPSHTVAQLLQVTPVDSRAPGLLCPTSQEPSADSEASAIPVDTPGTPGGFPRGVRMVQTLLPTGGLCSGSPALFALEESVLWFLVYFSTSGLQLACFAHMLMTNASLAFLATGGCVPCPFCPQGPKPSIMTTQAQGLEAKHSGEWEHACLVERTGRNIPASQGL